MIPNSDKNFFIYLADTLPKYKPLFKNFIKAIQSSGLGYGILKGTADIGAVEYMPVQISEKTFVLRLLDPGKTEDEKMKWQIINMGLPVALILIFAFIYQAIRNRKYAA